MVELFDVAIVDVLSLAFTVAYSARLPVARRGPAASSRVPGRVWAAHILEIRPPVALLSLQITKTGCRIS